MSTFEGFDKPIKQYKVSELKYVLSIHNTHSHNPEIAQLSNRQFLRARSLKVGGLKKELIARLTQALEKEKAESQNKDNNEDVEDDDEDEPMMQQDPPSNCTKSNIEPSSDDKNTEEVDKENEEKKEQEKETEAKVQEKEEEKEKENVADGTKEDNKCEVELEQNKDAKSTTTSVMIDECVSITIK